MDSQLLLLFVTTFVIHFVGTSAYAIRIAGVSARRIAISLSLFSILILLARMSTAIQAPLLSSRIESFATPALTEEIIWDMRALLLVSTAATVIGTLFVPTAQRLFVRAIGHFDLYRSAPRLLYQTVLGGGLLRVGSSLAPPRLRRLLELRADSLPFSAIILNMVAQAILTLGVMSALLAGMFDPSLKLTSLSLAPMINGVAVIAVVALVDPQVSALSDDVMEGRRTEGAFRRAMITLLLARVMGTCLAQLLLEPAAWLVVALARVI